MRTERSADFTFAGTEGTCSVWFVRDTIYLCRIVGAIDDPLADAFIGAVDRWIGGRHNLVAFLDWEAVTTYDDRARRSLISWIIHHRGQFDRVHFLVHSKIVELGIAFANIVVGHVFEGAPDRAAFERTLEELASRRSSSGR